MSSSSQPAACRTVTNLAAVLGAVSRCRVYWTLSISSPGVDDVGLACTPVRTTRLLVVVRGQRADVQHAGPGRRGPPTGRDGDGRVVGLQQPRPASRRARGEIVDDHDRACRGHHQVPADPFRPSAGSYILETSLTPWIQPSLRVVVSISAVRSGPSPSKMW